MDSISATQKLVVKIPFLSDGREEIIVDMNMGWSVRQLKNHLESIMPKNPKADEQKLILAGRILSDATPLKECFQKISPDRPPVVHLVCKTAEPDVPISEAQIIDGTRHRRPGNGLSYVPSTPEYQNLYPQYNPWMPNDSIYMMRAYQSYLQHYQHYASAFGSLRTPMQTTVAPPPNFNPHLPHFAFPGMQNMPPQMPNPGNAPQFQQEMPQAAGGLIMNAQGGAMIEENVENQRDMLDWAYTTVRFILLLFLVFLSSSTTRFFSFFTLAAFFVLFNTFREFRRWRERLNQLNLQAEPVPEPDNVRGVEAPPQAQNGIMSTVINILVGFVASLIPENLAHAVGN